MFNVSEINSAYRGVFFSGKVIRKWNNGTKQKEADCEKEQRGIEKCKEEIEQSYLKSDGLKKR